MSGSRLTSSCLYRGEVYHHRALPAEHGFRYQVYFFYIDLGEQDQLFRGRWFWSTHRPAPFRFHREDYLQPTNIPLDTAVREYVLAETGMEITGPIRLLTQIRHFGFLMNPVSFYYCFDRTGTELEVVLAEVTNTPWGEKHVYVLPRDESGRSQWKPQPKEFHVSPFMGMEQQYHWEIETPSEELSLRIENFEAGEHIFSAGMRLQRRPLTGFQLVAMLARYPFVSGKIAAGIYWQALRLWWKGVPFHPHPRRTHQPE